MKTELNINKILVIQTAFIGDVILTTPLIVALKEIYPNVIIDILVAPQCKIILETNPLINQIHVLDKKKFYSLILKIKKEHYDLSVSPHSSFRSGITALLAGINNRIGFKRNFQQFFLTKSIPHKKGVHKIYKNLDLALLSWKLGVGNGESNPLLSIQTKLYPSSNNYQKAEKILQNINERDPRKIILIAPGSVWFTKRWLLINYFQLTQKLIEKKYYVILAGAPAEKELNEYILNKIDNKAYVKNIAGDFDLLDSAALIEKIDLVVCNDSGILHIANAMNTPVFAIFGPTVKSLGYFPYQKNDYVFEADLECRPCGSHGGIKCPKKHFNCMKMVTVEVVFNEIIKRLG